jgi:hypothetical protein
LPKLSDSPVVTFSFYFLPNALTKSEIKCPSLTQNTKAKRGNIKQNCIAYERKCLSLKWKAKRGNTNIWPLAHKFDECEYLPDFPNSASTCIRQKNLLPFCAVIHHTCQIVLWVLAKNMEITNKFVLFILSKCLSPKQKLKEEITGTNLYCWWDQMFKP